MPATLQRMGVMKLLVIEDDLVFGRALQKGLCEAGHDCQWAQAGGAGRDLAAHQRFDAVVLDLMLPDVGGQDVLGQLRSQGIATPVLILTALGSVDDRVSGLRSGADDYLVKPFAFAELLARLEAICRRASPRPVTVLCEGPLVLDLTTRCVTREAKELDLTPTEFCLLEYLMRHSGQVVTRKMLCEHLWEADWEGITNVIEVHINRLRAKIDRGFEKPLIHTVRGLGYAFRSS
jgi:two-component system OmpR family response regulator/two-component system copper resistance phosphate regulon response regulator CusR